MGNGVIQRELCGFESLSEVKKLAFFSRLHEKEIIERLRRSQR